MMSKKKMKYTIKARTKKFLCMGFHPRQNELFKPVWREVEIEAVSDKQAWYLCFKEFPKHIYMQHSIQSFAEKERVEKERVEREKNLPF